MKNFLLFIISFVFAIYFAKTKDENLTLKNDILEKGYSIDNSYVSEVRGKVEFVKSISSRLPDFRFVIVGDSDVGWVDSLKIFQADDTTLKQVIELDAEFNVSPLPRKQEYFFAEDYNYDGYKDIRILAWWGGSGGESYIVWIYNPKNKLFETDDFYRSLSNAVFDFKKRLLETYDHNGDGDNTYELYKFFNNKYNLILEVEDWTDEGAEHDKYFVRDIKKRIDGKVKLISSERNGESFGDIYELLEKSYR